MGSKKKSTTSSSVNNQTNNTSTNFSQQGIDGIAVAGNNNNVLDGGVIARAFDFSDDNTDQAFDFARDVGGKALNFVGEVHRQSVAANQRHIKDFAEYGRKANDQVAAAQIAANESSQEGITDKIINAGIVAGAGVLAIKLFK